MSNWISLADAANVAAYCPDTYAYFYPATGPNVVAGKLGECPCWNGAAGLEATACTAA